MTLPESSDSPPYKIGQHIRLGSVEYIVVSKESDDTYKIRPIDEPKYWWADCFPQWKENK